MRSSRTHLSGRSSARLRLIAVGLALVVAPAALAAQPTPAVPTFQPPAGSAVSNPLPQLSREMARRPPPLSAEARRRLVRGDLTLPWATVTPCAPVVQGRATLTLMNPTFTCAWWGDEQEPAAQMGNGQVRLTLFPDGAAQAYAVDCTVAPNQARFTVSSSDVETATWEPNSTAGHITFYVVAPNQGARSFLLRTDPAMPWWIWSCEITLMRDFDIRIR